MLNSKKIFESMSAYLEFYGKNNVIPVHQKINSEHMNRRSNLYRSLGCPPLVFNNSHILEIGPGTGDNAVVTSTFDPHTYTLIDGNFASIQCLKDKIQEGLIKNARLIQADVMSQEFISLDKTFDVVICEGASAQVNPSEFYKRVLLKVKPKSGISIVTCSSSLSSLSELMRKLWFYFLTDKSLEEAKKIGTLVFTSHLSELSGVSRSVEDWVVDSILNPIPQGFSFSISNLIHLCNDLGLRFHASSSPSFFVDYDWYKMNTSDDIREHNNKVLKCWEDHEISTLDTRIQKSDVAKLGPASKEIVDNLAPYLSSLTNFVVQMYADTSSSIELTKVIPILENINACLCDHECLNQTSQSIIDLISAIPELAEGNHMADVKTFKGFWGRAQQYISLTAA